LPIRQRKRNCFEHAEQVATQYAIREDILAQLSGGGIHEDSLRMAGLPMSSTSLACRRKALISPRETDVVINVGRKEVVSKHSERWALATLNQA
jgi:hypothetical protein